MPRLTVWYVRVALVSLLAGISIGGWFMPRPGAMPRAWLLTHIELLFAGWFFHLAFGVAAWVLPRARAEPHVGDPRLGWASFLLLFGGMSAAVGGRIVGLSEGALVPMRGAQLTGCVVFIAFIWRRIRSFGP